MTHSLTNVQPLNLTETLWDTKKLMILLISALVISLGINYIFQTHDMELFVLRIIFTFACILGSGFIVSHMKSKTTTMIRGSVLQVHYDKDSMMVQSFDESGQFLCSPVKRLDKIENAKIKVLRRTTLLGSSSYTIERLKSPLVFETFIQEDEK